MTNNLAPYIVLAAIVAASLVWKGYFKFPSLAKAASNPGPSNLANGLESPSAVDIDSLVKLGSDTLGLAFAKAVRAEAESAVGGQFAREAAEALHAKFTAPFSPAPAGPDPNQAGVQP